MNYGRLLSANFLIVQVLQSAVDMTAPRTHRNHRPARPLHGKTPIDPFNGETDLPFEHRFL
jgi:hypothetical protein